jgi:hypothetical protein
VLDRSVLNLGAVSIAHPTTPAVFSGALNYLANEAQTGSEYEIEIDGTITTPSVTAVPFTFDYFIDGAAFGASTAQGIGQVILQAGNTYGFTVRYRADITSTGSGGLCNVFADGVVAQHGVNAGNAQTFTTMNAAQVNCAFDTTGNHTLAIYANFGGTPTTGSAVTYRTKITRRY